ncbi:MAG: CBS domain-containing protein [Magnetococcales bacterium]|nr:CBS domain-containing protein [Magnetococcales bacterium]
MASSSRSPLEQITVEFLRRHVPFRNMAIEHVCFLAGKLSLSYYGQQEVIVAPGDGVARTLYIIKQGMVVSEEAQSGSSGEATQFTQLMEGECFPLGALRAGRPVSSVFRAVGDLFLWQLDADALALLREKSAPFRDFCDHPLTNMLKYAFQTMQTDFLLSETAMLSLPLQQLIRRQPITCTPETTVGVAMDRMHQSGVGCLAVVDEQSRIRGIFTLHDVLERVALPCCASDRPVSDVMTLQPLTLPSCAPAHEAILAMARLGVRHVLVVDGERLCGVVTERDLFSLQRISLGQIHGAIQHATDLIQLRQIGQDIVLLIRNMLVQGVGAEHVTETASLLNEQLACRIIHLEHQRSLEQGLVSPHMDYCWLAMGSEGRRELTMRSDQDNGILFTVTDGMDLAQARHQLTAMALRINNHLDYCGFPLCHGKIMAGNPKWCLTLSEWQSHFRRWIDYGDPESLLQASIFFDFRSIYGHHELAANLRQWLTQAAVHARFLHQMTLNALRNRPPLGIFRDFALNSEGGIDLKLHGIMPFIDAARIFALAAGRPEVGTKSRLSAVMAHGKLDPADVESWTHAFHFLQWLRLRHQLQLAEQGQTLSHTIQPQRLNELDRRILKEVLRQARKLQARLAMDFQP